MMLLWALVPFGVLALSWKQLLRLLVRARLGPYRVQVNVVDPALPRSLAVPRTVAVLGGGLAGIAAASTLAARGYTVTLFEAQPYLGGKLGSWPVKLSGGETEWVSHGFHAFFRHYYNLNRFLDGLGIRQKFKAISDYRIVFSGGDELTFGELDNTPILNLLSLARRGVYRLGDALKSPTRDLMGLFLEYDAKKTFEQLDGMSFAEFDRLAKLPPRLKLAFNTFARAFFSDEHRLSMAELVKSFHFYFLGHDGGLTYDHPAEDFEASLLTPIRAHLSERGVTLKLGTRVTQLSREDGGFQVNGAVFDKVVLATDVVGTKAIVTKARGLEGISSKLGNLEPGQRYAVLRVWIDKAARKTLPVFVISDRVRLLDAITFYERTEAESARWAERNGGSVLELHSYAVPDDIPDEQVKPLLLEEAFKFLPELVGMKVRDEHFQLRRDFTSFHLGADAKRPVTQSGVPGLVCAGDWVKLPFPSMLMEAAFTSGLVAANSLMRADGLQEEPVESVPLRGLLAGVPPPPTRARFLSPSPRGGEGREEGEPP